MRDLHERNKKHEDENGPGERWKKMRKWKDQWTEENERKWKRRAEKKSERWTEKECKWERGP